MVYKNEGFFDEKTERRAATNLALIVARLLLDPRGWRVDLLKQELGISRSTFFNYLQRIRDLPIREFRDKNGNTLVALVKDGDATYLRLKRLGDAPENQDDFFSRVVVFEMITQMFAFLGDAELRDQLKDIRREFLAHVKQKHFVFHHLLRNLDRIFFVLPWAPKDYSGKRTLIKTILRGLEGPYRLRIKYETPGREPWEKILEPLTLVVHESALYLIVRSPEDGYIFTLAVDRIRSAEKTGEEFRYPSREEYDPKDHTDGAFGMFISEGDPVEVELIFANKPWLKKSLRERWWHKTQKFFDLPDGRLRMTFKVNSMTCVWPWIRSFGELVEVVKPAGERASADNH